ncbi:histidine phosphatase family protein [Rhodovibrionaceae bacterium A322]
MTRLTPLVLLRHGPTRWNAQGRLQGRRDIPLSEAGRREVRSYQLPAEYKARRWFVSPLHRARETANLTGIQGAEPLSLLREMDWGQWEGQRLAELRHRLGPRLKENEDRGLDFCPEGGESPRQVQARLAPWLQALAERGQASGAVAHKGIIRALYAWAVDWNMLGKPPEKLKNGCFHLFDITPSGQPRLIALNQPLLPNTDRDR